MKAQALQQASSRSYPIYCITAYDLQSLADDEQQDYV
jgi:hypothetical protein